MSKPKTCHDWLDWLDHFLRQTIARNRENIARSKAKGEPPEDTAVWEAQVRELEALLDAPPPSGVRAQLAQLRAARSSGQPAN